ncbi:MAG: ATP-dependent sacrificial sulfur transferase LarE [Chloroflexi bacterium]|nr:ATP-dependent sacrificial sulfur transferase LarE [Chloroflexota bacterium]
MTSNTDEKLGRLKELVYSLDSVLVAYSGGCDSTLLLSVCHDVLGANVLAATAVSPTYPAREREAAVKLARAMNVRHILVETREMESDLFTSNPADRCYHCKVELWQRLSEIAREQGLRHLADGSNCDDRNDNRPGMRAGDEAGVRRPLQEASLTKADVRAVSRQLGLPTWNKPSLSCLAARFPYGTPVTREALSRVEAAEALLWGLGLNQVRVRHLGDTARIEVETSEMRLLLDEPNRKTVVTRLQELGYRHVTLDLAGYRSGSLNEDVIRG